MIILGRVRARLESCQRKPSKGMGFSPCRSAASQGLKPNSQVGHCGTSEDVP